MKEGDIFTYNGTIYKYSAGRVWGKVGVVRPWRPIHKHDSDKMLKEIEVLKKDPDTKVYGK